MPTERIIVGYDGSPTSVVAGRWAAAEASLRLEPLRVIASSSGAELVHRLGAHHRDLACGSVTILGEPRDVLVRASHDASMLVVGATSSRRLPRLCGSVAASLTRRARCPLVVVPLGATSRRRPSAVRSS